MSRPNILLITTDEQHCRTLGIYGNGVVQSPCLDRLGETGVVFDRAYCADPLCSPSRSSILTGQYPSHHRCWTVGVSLPKTAPSVARILADHGYRTALLGKAHFQPWEPADGHTSEEATRDDRNEHDFASWTGPYYGFQEVRLSAGLTASPCPNNFHYGAWLKEQGLDVHKYFDALRPGMRRETKWENTLWQIPLEYHHSVWTARLAVEYLARAAKSQEPFFAWVSFHDPHDPYRVPNPYHDRYRPEEVLPLVRRPDEMDDKPPHYQQYFHGTDYSWLCDDEGGFRSVPAGYELNLAAKDFPQWKHRLWNACIYGMVDLLDDQVGRILTALDELGLTDDTLVVFTTDHGSYMGNHYFWFKGPFHYEDVIRVPLIVRWPGRRLSGRRIQSVVSLIDLAPTFLEAADIDVPQDMDGRSLLPILTEDAAEVRKFCMVENRTTRTKLYAKTIVDRRYKATIYPGQSYGELYDLQEDPDEFVNLWDHPDKADLRAQMMLELICEQARTEQNIPPRIGYA